MAHAHADGTAVVADTRNFFAKMETRWEDVQIGEDGGIPTKLFIQAAKGLIGIFGKETGA